MRAMLTKYKMALGSAFWRCNLDRMKSQDSLSESELHAEALKAYNDADATVEAQARELELSARKVAGPFLEFLTKFATRHYSELEQFFPQRRPH